MKTEQLVKSLAVDAIVERNPIARAAWVAYPAGLVAVAVAFFAFLGPRGNLTEGHVLFVTGMKLMITFTLAVTGVASVLQLARPDASARTVLLAAVPTLCLLALALVFDLSTTGVTGWEARLVGLHGWRCVAAVTVMSCLPLAATLVVLDRGAVTRHTAAGVVAGLAATGIGASFYALNCTDDSPLFMVTWYGIAALIVVALGIVGCRCLVRW